MLIFNSAVAAGATAEIQLPYLPQNLLVNIPGFALQVNVLGTGVIFDVAESNLMSVIGTFGKLTDTTNVAQAQNFILSDGVFGKSNVVIYLRNTTGGALTPEVYAYSTNRGTRIFATVQQRIYANSGITVTDFTALAFNLVSGNRYNITFADGTVQNMDNFELANLLQYGVNTDVPTTTVINNQAGLIQSLNIIPTTDQNIVIQNFR